jgi:hypothetical protein
MCPALAAAAHGLAAQYARTDRQKVLISSESGGKLESLARQFKDDNEQGCIQENVPAAASSPLNAK